MGILSGIDVGADIILRVRRTFARISPNLPEKFLCAKHSMKTKNDTRTKKLLHFISLSTIFSEKKFKFRRISFKKCCSFCYSCCFVAFATRFHCPKEAHLNRWAKRRLTKYSPEELTRAPTRGRKKAMPRGGTLGEKKE